ncbi:MAG: hypothetical protein WCW44_03395 [archaeon]|jgi:hypothetical protein
MIPRNRILHEFLPLGGGRARKAKPQLKQTADSVSLNSLGRKPGWLLREMYKRNMRITRNVKGMKGKTVAKLPHYKVMQAAARSYGFMDAAKALEKQIEQGRVSVPTAKSLLEKIIARMTQEITKTPESTKLAISNPKVPHEQKTGKTFLISQEFTDSKTGAKGVITFSTGRAILRMENPK